MKYWSRYPVFRFLIPFGAGILTKIYVDVPIPQFALTGTIFYLLSWLFTTRKWATGKYAQRWLAGIPFYMLYYCLGVVLVWLHTQNDHRQHFSEYLPATSLTAEITNGPVKTFSGWRYETLVNSVSVSGKWLPARGKLLLSYRYADSLPPFATGDLIITSAAPATIRKPSNPDEFDYAFHMSLKGIYHRAFTDHFSCRLLEKSDGWSVRLQAINVRNQLLRMLNERIPEKEALGVAGALLLGYEEWLDPEVENDYAMSGVLHILCVSGMHVGLLYMILNWLLFPMNKVRWLRHFRFVLFILLIWFYSLITGFAPSIVRAATMFTFVLIGQWLEKPTGIYNTLCASCFFMFMFDPFMIMAPGFQLSFLAVLGIVVLQRPLLYLYQPASWIGFKIWELAAVSIAAQIATAPLSLYLFHQFPNYFLPANIIAVPLTTLGMYLGLFLFAVDWCQPVAQLTGITLTWLIVLVNEVIAFFGKLPGAITTGISLSVFEMLILYLIIALLFFWLTKKSFSYLQSALIFTVVLLSSNLVAVNKTKNTNQLMVFHTKGSDVVSFIHDRNALLLTDSSFSDFHYRFSVEGALIKRGVEQIQKMKTEKGKFYSFEDDKIIFINNFMSSDSINILKPVILIIGGKCHPSLESVIQKIRPEILVTTSGFKMWKAAEMMKRLKSDGIQVHEVKSDGAFVMDL